MSDDLYPESDPATNSDTTPENRPRVIDVPLDKKEKERKLLLRRIVGTMLSIVALAMIIAALAILLNNFFSG